jgi:hypothetical protein
MYGDLSSLLFVPALMARTLDTLFPLKGDEDQAKAGFADVNLLPTKSTLDYGVHLQHAP